MQGMVGEYLRHMTLHVEVTECVIFVVILVSDMKHDNVHEICIFKWLFSLFINAFICKLE